MAASGGRMLLYALADPELYLATLGIYIFVLKTNLTLLAFLLSLLFLFYSFQP